MTFGDVHVSSQTYQQAKTTGHLHQFHHLYAGGLLHKGRALTPHRSSVLGAPRPFQVHPCLHILSSTRISSYRSNENSRLSTHVSLLGASEDAWGRETLL